MHTSTSGSIASHGLLMIVVLSAGCGDSEPEPEVDGGVSRVDGGTPRVDGGTSEVDGGSSVDDGGAMVTRTECTASSPCFYVTEAGAGARDGSSWADAHDGLPTSGVHTYLELPIAVLVRGTTYLVADGTYPGYVLGNLPGNDLVTIRKAIVADHGDDAGWDDTMGDGEAVFEASSLVIGFSPSAKHYLIDGQVGAGRSPGTYGFRLYATGPRSEGGGLVNIDATGTYADVGDVFDITFSHVDFDWNNGTAAGPCAIAYGIQIHGARDNGDWTVTDSYFHHGSGGAAYIRNGSNYVFRNDYFHQMGDETDSGACPGAPDHGHWEIFWVTIANGFELSGSTFENAYEVGQTGWVMLEATNVDISDNLFFCSDMDVCSTGGNGIIAGWSSGANHDVSITHNTFRDLFNGSRFLFEMGTNIVIRDNVYDNAPGLADDM